MMNFTITYSTKERKYLSAHTYQLVQNTIEVKPTRIFRQPCGRGEAANRYHYQIECKAPEDAQFVYDGMIRVNLNRMVNKHFKPKQWDWNGSYATMQRQPYKHNDNKEVI
jgi:hypothetical protein